MSAAAENYRAYLSDPVAVRLALEHGLEVMRRNRAKRAGRKLTEAVARQASQAAGQRANLLNRGGFDHVEKRIVMR